MEYLNNIPQDRVSIVKTSVSTFIARVITFLLSISINILIARILGPTGRGMWAALVLIPTFTYALLNLGIEQSNVYFTGSKKYKSDEIINNSFYIAFWVVIVIFIIYYFSFDKIYQFLSLRYPGLKPQHLYLVLFGIPFVFVFNYLNGILQGEERIYTSNIISVISMVLTISGILVALLVFRLNLLGIVYVYLGVRIINTFIILSIIRRGKSIKPKLNLNRELMKDSLKYGFKSYLASGLELLNFRVDVFLIYAILGPGPLGFYAIAVAVSEIIWFISHSVAFPLFPRISNLGSEDSKPLVLRTSRIVFWISIASTIVLSIVVHWLIPLLFGSSFIPSIEIVYYLLPGILFFSPVGVISTYFKGIGKPEVNTLINSITLIANVGLNLFLIPYLGVMGAAIASAISYIISYLIYLILYSAETETSPIMFFHFNINDFRKI